MTGELVPRSDKDLILAASPDLADAVRKLFLASAAKNTQRAYCGDMSRFAEWCRVHAVCPFPASQETLVHYVAWLATEGNWWTGAPVRLSTIERALCAISVTHKAAERPSPRGGALQLAMKGIRRTLRSKQEKKAPLYRADIERMIEKLPPGLRGVRDTALLWLGWSWALRRSELVAVKREHLTLSADGIVLMIPESKTDQAGAGVSLGVHSGPATEAILPWLDVARAGPVFVRFDRYGAPIFGKSLEAGQVSRIVKRCVARLKRPEGVGGYGGHSLRSGWMSQASKDGVPLQSIMRHSRHESVKIALGYIREATPFDEATKVVWK